MARMLRGFFFIPTPLVHETPLSFKLQKPSTRSLITSKRGGSTHPDLKPGHGGQTNDDKPKSSVDEDMKKKMVADTNNISNIKNNNTRLLVTDATNVNTTSIHSA